MKVYRYTVNYVITNQGTPVLVWGNWGPLLPNVRQGKINILPLSGHLCGIQTPKQEVFGVKEIRKDELHAFPRSGFMTFVRRWRCFVEGGGGVGYEVGKTNQRSSCLALDSPLFTIRGEQREIGQAMKKLKFFYYIFIIYFYIYSIILYIIYFYMKIFISFYHCSVYVSCLKNFIKF